ncbi:acetate--CoA ligase family protein [Cyanobacterium stanieri LEGE 03274]|uniref:Acetate--CoA ligase family protein n=1 Tax=Cyanobacterium stanieri LEGE 03274 TaxID=1828756 RepID=A0ABR9UZJ2_9CHRO|nr:ATP-grasp domain-containing protein [Cyanobacterium stanieri]MBE9221070.1 acetate--CoA ligase family protein [Cyanobacterium stanieri LEGE 03274]
MDLLEYQAKKLFNQVGIPVLPSQPLSSASELKNLQIPYPVVLKSQVMASGRAKLGGVKFVNNTIDAIAACQSIFSLAIEKEYPKVILAESRYNAQKEIFLAIMLDYKLKKPVIFGSGQGGINIEELLNNLVYCPIKDEYSPFYGRRLAKKMGLQGKTINAVTNIINKMYRLFIDQDLDMIEINPLGINHDGAVMALDGKIRVNDYGLLRHPELSELIKPIQDSSPHQSINYSPNNSLFSQFNINTHQKTALISASIDKAIFSINNSQNIISNDTINTCFILEKPCNQITSEDINEIFYKIIKSETINKVLVDLPLEYQFNYSLIQVISKHYPTDFSHWSNKNDERGDRPTGTRFEIRESNKNKTSFALRKIDWIIKTKGDKLNNQINNLPITIINII